MSDKTDKNAMIVSKKPFTTVYYVDKNEYKAKKKAFPSSSGRATPVRRGAGQAGVKATPNLSPVASSGNESFIIAARPKEKPPTAEDAEAKCRLFAFNETGKNTISACSTCD